MVSLYEFILESNRIEGIPWVSWSEEDAHKNFLALDELRVMDVCNLVNIIAQAPIRDRVGMDVTVGESKVSPGGLHIPDMLRDLIGRVNSNKLTPFQAHCQYENLHPFMDGNGRSGRAIWAWHMIKNGKDPFKIPFLREFYYQSIGEYPQ